MPTIRKAVRANPGAPIETADGLREAVLDLITDEAPDPTRITAAWIAARLPYGSRVRHILRECVRDGELVRIGYGVYSRP